MRRNWFSETASDFRVGEHASNGDVRMLAETLEQELAQSPAGPFRDARGFQFTNSTADVREWLERCAVLLAQKHADYPSLYTELNGFAINYDRWFASLFAWTEFIPPASAPDSWDGVDIGVHYREDLTLTGCEPIQHAFRWWYTEAPYQGRSEPQERAVALAEWLVWSRWLTLLKDAWDEGPIPGVTVALTATAHDFDVTMRLEPQTGQARV